MIRMLLSGVVVIGVVSLTFGCAEYKYLKKQIEDKTVRPRDRFVKVPPEETPEGSLWRNRSDNAFLFTDLKAFRVNDLLTVRIADTATASREAETKTGRTSTLKASVRRLFGLEKKVQGAFSAFNLDPTIDTSMQNDFDGSGETSRKEDFTATMTTRVMDVLPNGNMVIEGHREITVNNEVQWISLNGIVRPRDVLPDNSVLSTQVADLKIEYTGVGVISEKQRPGWFTRILDYVWPF